VLQKQTGVRPFQTRVKLIEVRENKFRVEAMARTLDIMETLVCGILK
jgi:hypothetical protein